MKKILLSLFALFCASNLMAVERITVQEFLEKKDTETVYELAGVVKSIKNTTYGNFYLEQDGYEIYVYGVVNAEGTTKIWSSLGINEGDNIVIQGAYLEYNGTPEIKNALYISHESTGTAVDITNTPETAYTTSEASDIIAAGKGLATKVYVKGTISELGEFSADNGNYTYTITDGTKSIIVFRGKYFNGDKFTSEDQIQDGDDVVVYGQLTSYNGTDEINAGSTIYSLNGKTTPDVAPYTLVGAGTKENPYTVDDVKNLYTDAENTPADEVWVTGTILGNVNTSTGVTIVPNVFTDVNGDGKVDKNDCGDGETAAVATNLSVGNDNGNIAVQLPVGDARTALNVLDNPTNIGKTVSICGLIQKYCGVAGLKNVKYYILDGVDGINAVSVEVNDGAIYNVAGQRVSENYKGIVVKNGKKYIAK